MAACAHCRPFLNDCDHVCQVCSIEVDLDNCDGDMVDGRMVGYEGSTKGFRCDSCMVWTHNECGDPKQELCRPCLDQFGAVA